MNRKIYRIVMITFIALGLFSLNGCGSNPDLEYEGELHFVLSGLMGEYGMREGGLINESKRELRITAYFVKDNIVYRLNFSDETEYDSDQSNIDGTLHVSAEFPIHSQNKYRIEGLFYPNWNTEEKPSNFMPLSDHIYNTNIYTDFKIGRITTNGYGIPVDHSPVLVREILVDNIEMLSEGSGNSNLHFGIRANHVFQKNIVVTGSDMDDLISFKGYYENMVVPDWTQTTDPETIKTINAEHKEMSRIIFTLPE